MASEVMPALSTSYLYNHCGCRRAPSMIRVVLGLSLIGLGLVLLLVPSTATNQPQNLSIALMVGGVVAIVIGLYYALFNNSLWIYEPTGSAITHHSVFFSAADMNRAKRFADTASEHDMPQPRYQGHLLLDVFSAQDGSMACIQLNRYVNFDYEPISYPLLVVGMEAEHLRSLIIRCRSMREHG